MAGKGVPTRRLRCWIESFEELVEYASSPPLYKKWAAVWALAAAAERRVWVMPGSRMPIFPNLFVLLLGPPGIGKTQTILPLAKVFRKANQHCLIPSRITREALLDWMKNEEAEKVVGPDGKATSASAIGILSEFGNLMGEHSLNYIATLCELWDCDDEFKDQTRHSGQAHLDYPCISMLAGVQPQFLSEFFPDAAWGMGLFARIIIIYADENKPRPLFEIDDHDEEGDLKRLAQLRDDLALDLALICSITGRMRLTEDAKRLFAEWEQGGCMPVPQLDRLEHYNTRRHIFVIKLAMAFSLSTSTSRKIDTEHITSAIELLLEAETHMPRAMASLVQGSHDQAARLAASYIRNEFTRTKRPIAEATLLRFLGDKVHAQQIRFVIQYMLDARFCKIVGSVEVPGARNFIPD